MIKPELKWLTAEEIMEAQHGRLPIVKHDEKPDLITKC
jgi:hypothetical protein